LLFLKQVGESYDSELMQELKGAGTDKGDVRKEFFAMQKEPWQKLKVELPNLVKKNLNNYIANKFLETHDWYNKTWSKNMTDEVIRVYNAIVPTAKKLGVILDKKEITKETVQKMMQEKFKNEGQKGMQEFVQEMKRSNPQSNPQSEQVQQQMKQPEPQPQHAVPSVGGGGMIG
jgi:hypothetical protein